MGHFPRDIQATLPIGTPTVSTDPTLRVLVCANRPCMRIQYASDSRITKLSTVKMCTHSSCSRGTPAKRPSGRVSGVNSLLKSRLDYPTSQPEWRSILMRGFASRLTPCTHHSLKGTQGAPRVFAWQGVASLMPPLNAASASVLSYQDANRCQEYANIDTHDRRQRSIVTSNPAVAPLLNSLYCVRAPDIPTNTPPAIWYVVFHLSTQHPALVKGTVLADVCTQARMSASSSAAYLQDI